MTAAAVDRLERPIVDESPRANLANAEMALEGMLTDAAYSLDHSMIENLRRILERVRTAREGIDQQAENNTIRDRVFAKMEFLDVHIDINWDAQGDDIAFTVERHLRMVHGRYTRAQWDQAVSCKTALVESERPSQRGVRVVHLPAINVNGK